MVYAHDTCAPGAPGSELNVSDSDRVPETDRGSAERPLTEYADAVRESADVRRGYPLPLGARAFMDGVNFTVFSRYATRVHLELFADCTDQRPARIIDLDPDHNRTGDIWHVWVKGILPGQVYAYRVDGPYDPAAGHRFNFNKLLLDPRATAITEAPRWNFDAAQGYAPQELNGDPHPSAVDNSALMPKCVFTRIHFDWGDDRPLRYPWSKTVIYETHVRGITVHPSSGVTHPGTYRGLLEKIPYLKDLGVTAVELLPVQEFNANELKTRDPHSGELLRNYWGYNPVAFTAVNGAYSSA